MGKASSEDSTDKRKEVAKDKKERDKKERPVEKKDGEKDKKQRKDKEVGKDKPKVKPKGREKDEPQAKEKARAEDSDDDAEKEKEKDKLAFLNAIKGLREKDKKVGKKNLPSESDGRKDRKKKARKCSSSPTPSDRKERRREKEKEKRKRERSKSKDESSGSESPPKPKETALVTSSGFGAPLALTSIVPAAVGASDVIGVFCRSAGADQNSEQALRALPAHFQQAVMAEGSIAGLNPSAVLMGRIRKVENNAGVASAAALAGLHRPRPETVAAAAAGDPVAKFCMQHTVDYSAENALRALPVELQCRILNEGPLRASNPSAVLMSRIRKAQTLLAEMRRLGKVPV